MCEWGDKACNKGMQQRWRLNYEYVKRRRIRTGGEGDDGCRDGADAHT